MLSQCVSWHRKAGTLAGKGCRALQAVPAPDSGALQHVIKRLKETFRNPIVTFIR
jgi:hypothetical protein